MESALRQGCRDLGLELSDSQLQSLLEYLELLVKWNRAYNLTAVRDPRQMVTRHLLDSLAIAALLKGDRFIDVGTGAGLPGIPLSILYPEREFHLLDSNGKKTRFLFQVKTALGLDNMTVHHARVESFRPAEAFDGILSRAFSSLLDMVTVTGHLLVEGGSFFAMKGAYPTDELADLPHRYQVVAVHPVNVPGLCEQRHLVEMTLRRVDSVQ